MSIIVKPKILIPKDVDMSKWAIIACDQFTAQPKYWNELEALVGDSKSTLNLVFPEIYLGQNDEKRIKDINRKIEEYANSDLFYEVDNFILVERIMERETRVGLMIAIDLDSYDWNRVRVPIRATEDTLLERLPVRIKIRKNAPMEFTHTLALIDDADKEIIEPIYKSRHKLRKLYDFELNMGGGRIIGYEVPNSDEIIEKIIELLDLDTQVKKYGTDAGVLMVIGDGNHSVATAKCIWEETKKTLSEEEQKDHPAKYMLVELNNIYGEGEFHPIHRIVYNPPAGFLEELTDSLTGAGVMKLYIGKQEEYIAAPETASNGIMLVQKFLEQKLKENPDMVVDYVHSEHHLVSAVEEGGDGTIGIVMPTFPKSELVNFVVNVGNLPKKSFSIGEAEEKRYYLEGRRIVK